MSKFCSPDRRENSEKLLEFASAEQIQAIADFRQVPVFVQLMIPGEVRAYAMKHAMANVADKFKE